MIASMCYSLHNSTVTGALAYETAGLWAIAVLILLGLAHDWWALGVVLILMLSRLYYIAVIHRRATAVATLLVYLGAALVSNAGQFGKILLLCPLIGSVGLLAIANVAPEELQMHGCIVRVQGERKSYERRLHLANELINETGRDDWAVRMAMIVKDGDQTGEL